MKKLINMLTGCLLLTSPMLYAATPATVNTAVANSTPVVSGQLINRAVAIVNNGVITQVDLDQGVAQAKMQIQQSGLPMPDDVSLQKQVLHQLILQKVALELAALNHITVSNAEVDEAIEDIANRNHFGISQLKTLLQQQGVSYDAYWQDVQNRLIINKLEQQAVANSILITPEEVDNYLAAKAKLTNPNTEYDVQHILLPLPSDPTAENLEKAKQQADDIVTQIHNGLAFTKAAMQYSQSDDALQGGDLGWKTVDQLPTVFANVVQTMQVGQVLGPIQTDTGFHIVKLANERTPATTQHFVTQYHVRDILIKPSPIITDAKAQEMLNDIRKQLQNGGDFAALAKANSQDLASMSNGGDLGWLSNDEVDPAFAAVMDSLAVNTLSQPFQTKQGWYLIEVLGTRQQDDTQNYLKVQAQNYLFQQKVNQAIQTWQNEIYGDSYIDILVPEYQVGS